MLFLRNILQHPSYMLDNQLKNVIFFFVLSFQSLVFAQIDDDIDKYSPSFEYNKQQSNQPNIIEQVISREKPTLPSYNHSLRVNSLLDSIYTANKQIKFMEGYRIQVYSGENKELANQAKELVYKIFPNADIYTIYKQPTYRIKLGDFIDKLEAIRVLDSKIKKPFPKALLISDNVFIKRKVKYE